VRRLARRVVDRRCHAVRLVEPLDAEEVRDDESVKAPLAAEHLAEEVVVHRAGHAVDGAVGGHHRAGARPHGRLDGRQEGAAQLALSEQVRSAVLSSVRGSVGGDVLERREGVLPFAQVGRAESLDEGAPHGGRQRRVLAVGLLGTRPARVTHHVEHRSVGDVCSLRADFRGDDPAHAADELRIPRRGLSQRRGEDRGTDGHESVGRLLGQEERDAPAAVLDGVALHAVGQLGAHAGREARFEVALRPRVGAEGAPQHADVALVDQLAEAVGQQHRVAAAFVGLPAVGALQLSDLLFEAHAAHQVGGTCRGALRRIEVERCRLAGAQPEQQRSRHDFQRFQRFHRSGISVLFRIVPRCRPPRPETGRGTSRPAAPQFINIPHHGCFCSRSSRPPSPDPPAGGLDRSLGRSYHGCGTCMSADLAGRIAAGRCARPS